MVYYYFHSYSFPSSARGSQGAWQRFERGELGLFNFYKEFGRDLSDTANGNVWYKEYCRRKNISECLPPEVCNYRLEYKRMSETP